MQLWYEAVAMEDQIPLDDPDFTAKMDAVDATLCAKYGITQEQLNKIVWEAAENVWPVPPLPE